MVFFFFNDTATTEIYTLSLHDALPISKIIERHFTLDRTMKGGDHAASLEPQGFTKMVRDIRAVEESMGSFKKEIQKSEPPVFKRSEEHTSELQSRTNLVCRLLLEKKKNNTSNFIKCFN